MSSETVSAHLLDWRNKLNSSNQKCNRYAQLCFHTAIFAKMWKRDADELFKKWNFISTKRNREIKQKKKQRAGELGKTEMLYSIHIYKLHEMYFENMPTSWASCRYSHAQEPCHQRTSKQWVDRSGCQKWSSSGAPGLGMKRWAISASMGPWNMSLGTPRETCNIQMGFWSRCGIEAIAQATHECETCAVIKWAKWLKSPWNSRWWLGYQYEKA